MAAPIDKTSSNYDFMYPDLLSRDGLLHILRQRYISHAHKDLDTMDKEALVGLYNRYILPTPQRTYRNNRRGTEMTKAQKVLDRKRKRLSFETEHNDKTPAKRLRGAVSSSGLVNHHSTPPSPGGSRLKPPPSCINFEKKLIRLKSDVKTLECKRSGDASSKASQNETETPKSPPVLNSHSTKSVLKGKEESPSDVLSNDAVPAKKKKFAPISWP